MTHHSLKSGKGGIHRSVLPPFSRNSMAGHCPVAGRFGHPPPVLRAPETLLKAPCPFCCRCPDGWAGSRTRLSGRVLRERKVQKCLLDNYRNAPIAFAPQKDGAKLPASVIESLNTTFLSMIRIQNFALVDDQVLRFLPGLNVITGESGAGKSVLVQAFSQLLGASTIDDCIRPPSNCAVIEGTFNMSENVAHSMARRLNALGFPRHKCELTNKLEIRREISQTENGMRSRCFVNEFPTSLRVLREIGALLVDVNGQHSSQNIREYNTQLSLLDRVAGTTRKALEFEEKLNRIRHLEKQLSELSAMGDEYERNRMQELCDRVLATKVMGGEEKSLKAKLQVMEAQRSAVEQCAMVRTSLSGDSSGGGITDAIQSVESQLRQVIRQEAQSSDRDVDEQEGESLLEKALEKLELAQESIYSARESVEEFAELSEFDPLEHEELRDRLRQVNVLLRDFDCYDSEELLEKAEEAERKLDLFYRMEGNQVTWENELEGLRRELAEVGCELSLLRRSAAGQLRGAVETCLQQLAMKASRFDVRISWTKAHDERSGIVISEEKLNEVGEYGSRFYRPLHNGFDQVEFLLAAGPAEPLRPLGTVASGGESARLMLALKSAPIIIAENGEGSEDVEYSSEASPGTVSAEKDEVLEEGAPVLVLDELDSGVGGRLGQTVGQLLKKMSETKATSTAQVLCVSHLPQVAAHANHHFKVCKVLEEGGRVTTQFNKLDKAKDRAEEVADMLGAGWPAAVELLCEAQGWSEDSI